MGTNCAPLLADLFLYSYEVDFIQGLLKKNENKLARSLQLRVRNSCVEKSNVLILLQEESSLK
jgi:uncharacterized membrane protein YheB (UPF0754 family)